MKQIIFILCISFFLIFLSAEIIYPATYTILMREGGSVEAANYVIEGENINVLLQKPQGATIVIPRADVDKIIKNEEENIKKPDKARDNRLVACETANVKCDQHYYYCCLQLDSLIKEMYIICDKAEVPRNLRDDLDSVDNLKSCRSYKNKISSLQNVCANCNLVKMCCQIR